MSTEEFDLDRRLESIKATAIKFVQDMDETIIVDGGMPVRRTSRVWSDEDDEDRWRSNLIGHELHRLFNDLMDAVVRKPSRRSLTSCRHPRGSAMWWANSSAHEMILGLSQVERRMACVL